MNTEQVKQRLNSHHTIQLERRQILDRIMRLEARLTAPGGWNLNGMPHGSSKGDTMARGVATLADLRETYRSKEIELTQALLDIEHLIDGLDPVERMIARYRYIDRMQWEQICVKISYSWRQTHRIHSNLIEKLAKRLEEAEVST